MKTKAQAVLVLAKNLDLDLFYVISIYPEYITLQGQSNDNSRKELTRFCNLTLIDTYHTGKFIFEDVLFEVHLSN